MRDLFRLIGWAVNVVYREIVDHQRVFDIVLAYRTRKRAPAVLAFIETCKGLQA